MRDRTRAARRGRRSGWIAIGAFALLACATQLLWLTYAPITTGAARYYGVSVGTVGWLAEIFPLVYVVLAVPAGRVLDRSLNGGLAAGALLTALGAALRLFGDDYGWALCGQCLVAIAQPLVLNAVGKLATVRLPERRRADGIALGSAGMIVGMLLALVLGAALGGGRIHAVLAIGAVVSTVAAIVMIAALRAPAAVPAACLQAPRRTLRAVWTDHEVRVLAGLLFVGFGVFIALATWLQALLSRYGVSANSAGGVLVAMVLLGAVGSGVLAPHVLERGTEQSLIGASIAVGIAGCGLLAVAHGFALDAVVLAIMGMLLLTDLPVILELSERRAGTDGGTVAALMWLSGNAGGLVVAVLVQALIHHPGPAFLLLALVAATAIPLVRALGASARAAPAAAPAIADAVHAGDGAV